VDKLIVVSMDSHAHPLPDRRPEHLERATTSASGPRVTNVVALGA